MRSVAIQTSPGIEFSVAIKHEGGGMDAENVPQIGALRRTVSSPSIYTVRDITGKQTKDSTSIPKVEGLFPTQATEQSIRRKSSTLLPLTQQKKLTQHMFESIKTSLRTIEIAQKATEAFTKPILLEDVYTVPPLERFVPSHMSEEYKEYKEYKEKIKNSEEFKALQAIPVKEFTRSEGYEYLQKLFGFNALQSVDCIFNNQVTLTVEKDGDSHTLILMPNRDNLSYWPLPGDIIKEPEDNGGYKVFWKTQYGEHNIPITQNYEPSELSFLMKLPSFEFNVDRAVKNNIPGTELIMIPKLIKNPYKETLMTALLCGEDLLNRISNTTKEERKSLAYIEKAKQQLRDIYMANKALEKIGYYNFDTKLSNSIILPLEEERVGIIDLDAAITNEIIATYCGVLDMFYDFLMENRAIAKDKYTMHRLLFQYYSTVAYVYMFSSLLHNTEQGTLLQSYYHLLPKHDYSDKFSTPVNEYPEYAFAIAQCPRAFLGNLMEIYKEKIDRKEDIIINSELLQDIGIILFNFRSYEEKHVKTEFDSIVNRIQMKENFHKHGKAIAENLDVLLKSSELNQVKDSHLIASYCMQENNVPKSSLRITPEENSYRDYDVKDFLFPVVSSQDNIHRVMNNLRTKLYLDPSVISDEDICFLIRMICNPRDIFYGGLRDIKKSLQYADKIIRKMFETDKYVKAVIPETIRKKAYVERETE